MMMNREAARAIGHAIHHQVRFGDRAMRGGGVVQVVLGGVEGRISDKQFFARMMFSTVRLAGAF